MKALLVFVILLSTTWGCSSRMTCPTTDKRYFYKKMGTKPYRKSFFGLDKRGLNYNAAYKAAARRNK